MGCKGSKPAIYPDPKAPAPATNKKNMDKKKWTPADAPEIRLFQYDVINNSCKELPYQ
jgi:hypothetical protein